MNIVFNYFPHLSGKQKAIILNLWDIYNYWNNKINVISRKDFHHFYERHVLHSLSISKYITFENGSDVLDVGTGGGFPGIPLAILFPETQFYLIDSIGKKVKVVEEVCSKLQITNVQAFHARAESMNHTYDFVVSRAVTSLPKVVSWIHDKIKTKQSNAMHNGLLYLKGGDFQDELDVLPHKISVFDLSEKIDTLFFKTKKLVHVEI